MFLYFILNVLIIFNRAKWVRLGELDIASDTDVAKPTDFSIVERVVHPDYKITENYNDIALFLLDSAVIFSAFMKPICLNTDQNLNPKDLIATGWGQTNSGKFFEIVFIKLY